ncbi:unnamed protein product [Rotaria socialis]|uniref:F-box domain-containing protein n=1 Tax=Rotaria socialis TaxID=392032 RepID=A0A819WBR5_9BILA|nr:unnamed protein product [Rotaria socialis]CAF4266886.1 unnamed protein product [Rotaria socialis]
MHWFMFDFVPVELLHSIFDYLWTNEILNSFLNINDYLDNVIVNCSGSFLNFHSISRPLFDLICRRLRPNHVISLVLSDSNDTPGQCQLLFSRFSIEQFSHLRALTLINIDDDSESFFTGLDKIESLKFLEVTPKHYNRYLQIMPKLVRFVVKYEFVVYFESFIYITRIQLLHLRHSTLTNCSYFMLKDIFRYAPMLVSLNISIMFESREQIENFVTINHGKSPIHLISLSVSIDVFSGYNWSSVIISRNHVEQFLVHTPRLRQLELIVDCDGNNNLSYGDRWERFIVERLPRLRTFYFKFKLENVYRNEQTVLGHFHTPFWLDKHRPWFVAYDRQRSLLFTVPHFAHRSIAYSEMPVLPHSTTLPIEQHARLYNMITELTFDSIKNEPDYCYKEVEKLVLIGLEINRALIDLSRVQYLSVNSSSWSLDMIVQLIWYSMPCLHYLSFNCGLSLKYSNSIIPLEQIHILQMPFFAYSANNENFDWIQLFSRVERLSITVNSCHELAILIDQFNNISYASFTVNNYCINVRRNLWEPRITREWLVRNTRRLTTLDNNSFTCRFDNNNIFKVYLWIGEDCKQQTTLLNTRASKTNNCHYYLGENSTNNMINDIQGMFSNNLRANL